MFRTSHVSEHSQAERQSLRGSIRTSAVTTLAAAILLGSLTGCMTVHNGWEALQNNGAWSDTVLVLRNRSFSAKAWHRRKHHFCNQKHSSDFCAGFRAGYEDVAGGGGECTPAFPPQQYWGWEFQSAEGAQRTSAWFAGYPHGARAAEEDGVGNYAQMQMSSALQSQYQQQGAFQHQGTVYPIPADATYGGAVNSPVITTDIPEGAILEPVPMAMPGASVPPAVNSIPSTNSTPVLLDPAF